MRQPEAALPLRTGQPRARVKPRAQAGGRTWSLSSAGVALKHNSAAAAVAYVRIAVTAVAIAVMTLPRLGVVAVTLPQDRSEVPRR